MINWYQLSLHLTLLLAAQIQRSNNLAQPYKPEASILLLIKATWVDATFKHLSHPKHLASTWKTKSELLQKQGWTYYSREHQYSHTHQRHSPTTAYPGTDHPPLSSWSEHSLLFYQVFWPSGQQQSLDGALMFRNSKKNKQNKQTNNRKTQKH